KITCNPAVCKAVLNAIAIQKGQPVTSPDRGQNRSQRAKALVDLVCGARSHPSGALAPANPRPRQRHLCFALHEVVAELSKQRAIQLLDVKNTILLAPS